MQGTPRGRSFHLEDKPRSCISSVSSQGPGRPFLLTKYCGRIFSARSGPVFGRELLTPKAHCQKERRGWRNPRRIQADRSFQGTLEKEMMRRAADQNPMPRKEALKRRNENETGLAVPTLHAGWNYVM